MELGFTFYLHRKGAEEDLVKEGAHSIIFIDDTYKEKEVSLARIALKCAPHTSSSSVTWEPVRNVCSCVPPQTYEIRNRIEHIFQMILRHSKV